MRHFFFVVYYCMVVAQGHSQPFNHTDGCHVFRSDTATDSFQFQLSKGVFQTRAGGFRTVTVMPVCVIEYIACLLYTSPAGYKEKPKFYVINFDDPRRSHRCNPTHPDFMEDITDAYESAYTIMLNLNKTWVQKQGDFFVESPIILFASIIWYLKIYQNGKYCTFPHAIEFLNRRYEDIFPILTSYPELENYLLSLIHICRC